MVVKLFRFLQPDVDIWQMFAQFAATSVAPLQSEAVGKAGDEELLSQTQGREERKDEEGEEEVAMKEAPDEMVTDVMVTKERKKESEERVTVDEALAIVEVPGERRLEVESEKDVAREATETRTEGAEEAPE